MNPWDIALHMTGAKLDEKLRNREKQRRYAASEKGKATSAAKYQRNKNNKTPEQIEQRRQKAREAYAKMKEENPLKYRAVIQRICERDKERRFLKTLEKIRARDKNA